MKVSFAEPPPLTFGEGENSFALILRRCTADHRMMALDAIQRNSYQSLQDVVKDIVTDWQNVLDENGRPIPFMKPDEKRGGVNHLDEFLAAVPLKLHTEIIAGLMAFMGFDPELCRAITDIIPDGGEINLDPTSPPDSDTQKNASGG